MENYIYAVFIDGESKYDKRKELMTTNDPLFPFLKNCMYGPKVHFIKDDGSYSFGIKLIDYGFVVNKNQTVLPLLPGSIIEGPIKKMDLQNTQHVIYQNILPIENNNEDFTQETINVSSEMCTSQDDHLQVTFGIMGDDMLFQQEDIELEEEIVCLQKNEEEASLSLRQDPNLSEEIQEFKNDRISDDKINYSDKIIPFNEIKESFSSNYSESDEEVGDNVSSDIMKISRSPKLKVKSKTEINRDIKDVANALVNFSSINEKMLLEKNKEGIEEGKVPKMKNHRKIKGSKLRKQGRKPSKLNISAKEKVDLLQNSDTEIAEQYTSNIDTKSTGNFESIEQSNSNDINFDNATILVKELQLEVLDNENNINIDSNDGLINIKNNIYKNNSDSQVQPKLKIYNNEKPEITNKFQDERNIFIEDQIVAQNESIQVNFPQVKTMYSETIITNIFKNQDYSFNSESEKSFKEIDENLIEQNIKDVNSEIIIPIIDLKKEIEGNTDVINISVVENEPCVFVNKEYDQNKAEQLTENPIISKSIYNKKRYVETVSKDSLEIMQRLRKMEEERREMQNEIRKEELRLKLWEQNLASRERNVRKRRSQRRKQ